MMLIDSLTIKKLHISWSLKVAFARLDICAYRNPDESSPCHSVLLITIHFKVILPSTPGFHKRSLSSRFLRQIIVCISLLRHPVLEHPRSVWPLILETKFHISIKEVAKPCLRIFYSHNDMNKRKQFRFTSGQRWLCTANTA